jgi:outer membrane protein insertion porin family
MKKIILLFTLLLFFVGKAVASESFVIKKIEIQGSQGVSDATLKNYLPVKVGDTLSTSDTPDLIRELYATGFFEHISLSRQENTLIIHVTERPMIGQLKVSGNSIIPTDKLTEVLHSVGVAEGRVYDKAVLDKIKLSLLNQYYQLGRYNARVDIRVSPLERNRVQVQIILSEGVVAKVRAINLIGVHAFKARDLNKQLTISTPGLFTFFTSKDQYSQEKLDASLENVRNYYLDRGYLKFSIKSSQAAITPDRKSIFVTIVVDEGDKYTVEDIDVRGNLILSRDELMKHSLLKQGDVFSKRYVMATQKRMIDALGDKGYAFAEVNVIPRVNEAKKQVFITFEVRPGKRVYVRQITFSENSKTNDEVLRREIEQMESSVISTSRLSQSKLRLNRLPYIKEVDMTINPVKGADDQADVNYKVKEDSAAQANFSVGYSQLENLLFSAGLNQKNFLGTGNTLGFNLSASRSQSYYGINFMNPYFTPDGVSRNLSVALTQFDPRYANSARGYNTNQISFSDVYGIPIGQEQGVFNRIQLGYGYENIHVDVNHSAASIQVNDFIQDHGSKYQEFDIITGFSRDSRDRYLFPTRGMVHTIGANIYLPLTSSSLSYYILDYSAKWYHPLTSRFIMTGRGEIGYGGTFSGDAADFPFFKNFYAGGIGSVRGYEGNRLGPRDSNGNSTGGNLLVDASLGLIFPNYVSDNLRTTLYVDAGNVYDTFSTETFEGVQGSGSGPVRFSVGIEADWLTPMGMIDISIAKPLNPKQHLFGGSEEEPFQFSIGANFG